MMNKMRAHKGNKSGVKNVHWHPASGKWGAVFQYRKQRYDLGIFGTIEEAQSAVIREKEKLGIPVFDNYSKTD
ncbi:hypothetical protein SD77_1371 [Bacillus badius]|uniref:AP2/ERF domain-containing protein n=2 Tax=Bacillus badius TaxID=1455 RepID=A0ABR5ASI1_BACBA|nr:hypothetical protein SD77_1371 [Bacillus badius]